MPYLKGAIVATFTALVMFVAAALVQAGRVGREIDRAIQANLPISRHVNLIPAFTLAVVTFAAVFVWRARRYGLSFF